MKIADDHIEISLKRSSIATALGAAYVDTASNLAPIILTIEAQLKRSGKGKRLVIENGDRPDINPGIVDLLQEAFNIRDMLIVESSDDSIEAMSQRLGINKHRLTSLIRLSYLSPEIIRALIEGRHPIELTPTRLLKISKDLPHDWRDQSRFLDFQA